MDEQNLSEAARQIKADLLGQFQLSVDDVAGILEVDRSTVYRYVQDGRLVALKLGREYRFTEADVREFIQGLLTQMREAARSPSMRHAHGRGRGGPLRHYTPGGRRSVLLAQRLAAAEQAESVEPVHLLGGMLLHLAHTGRTVVAGATLPQLPDAGEGHEEGGHFFQRVWKGMTGPRFSPAAKAVLMEQAVAMAQAAGAPQVGVRAVILAVLDGNDPAVTRRLQEWNVDAVRLKAWAESQSE